MKRSELQRQLLDAAAKFDAKYDELCETDRPADKYDVMDDMLEAAQILRSTQALLGILELD